MAQKKIYRAGIIPFIVEEEIPKMLFMRPSNPEYGSDTFQIAKGKMEEGETTLETAIREGKEELGLFIGNIVKTYDLGNFLGRTTVYLVEVKNKDMFGDPHFETKETKWMTAEEFQTEGRDIHKPVVKAAVRKIQEVWESNQQTLKEIEVGMEYTKQRVDTSSFDFKNGEQVAKGEGGLPVIKATSSTEPDWYGFALIKNGVPVATVYGKMAKNHPNYFVIMWAWVEPEYRRQGLITALYVALSQKARYKLVSDVVQSPSMKQVWASLPLPLKVVDTETWQTYDRVDFPDNKLYGNDRYRLLVEYTEPWNVADDKIGIPLCYPVGHGLLNEKTNYNPNADILDDYMKYTHPFNKGKFV